MNTNSTFLESGQTAKPETKAEPSSEASDNSSDLSKQEPDQTIPSENDADAILRVVDLLEPGRKEEEDGDGIEGEGEAREDEGQSDESGPGSEAAQESGGEAGGEGEVEDDEEGSTVSIRELAEHLGTNAQRVYKDLQVPLGNGETISLGELKDAHQEREDTRSEVAEREVQLQRREAATFVQQQELSLVMGDVSQYLSPETVEHLEAKQSERETRERANLYDKLPNFRDPAEFGVFREELVDLMGEFGYEPHEVIITDHRLAVLAKSFIDARKIIKKWSDAAEDGKRTGKRVAGGKGSKPGKATGLKRQLAEAAASDDTRDKVQAVSALIGE
jgi:hypothetical protein